MELLLEVGQLADELVAELFVRFADDLARDRAETAALEASVHDNLHTAFRMLAHRVSAQKVSLPPSALAWPRRLVHDGVSPHVLQRMYYVGHHILWRRWLFPRLAGQTLSAGDLARAAEYGEKELFTYFDRAAQQVLAEYEDEVAAAARHEPLDREQTVLGMLAGQVPTERQVAELGYHLDSTHQALIVWRDSRQTKGADAVHPSSVAERLCRALGHRHLIVERGPNETWAWVDMPARLGDEPLAVSGIGIGDIGDVHVAIGHPGSGPSGFRLTHEDAGRVQVAIAQARRPAPSITHYGEIALVTLLTANQEAAADYVHRQLGELGAEGSGMARLRQTVRVFLDTGGSHARTAEKLVIHRNTVRHRLSRAEQLLGRPVQHAGSELHNALLIAEWLRPGIKA
jgi:hypothetical protein